MYYRGLGYKDVGASLYIVLHRAMCCGYMVEVHGYLVTCWWSSSVVRGMPQRVPWVQWRLSWEYTVKNFCRSFGPSALLVPNLLGLFRWTVRSPELGTFAIVDNEHGVNQQNVDTSLLR